MYFFGMVINQIVMINPMADRDIVYQERCFSVCVYACLCVSMCVARGKYAALNCTFLTGCLDNTKRSSEGNLIIPTCVTTSSVSFYKLSDHKKFNKLKPKIFFYQVWSLLYFGLFLSPNWPLRVRGWLQSITTALVGLERIPFIYLLHFKKAEL